ncbi:MAG: hypothetical protein ACTSWN_01220 [Promethearchaeota archaeon]
MKEIKSLKENSKKEDSKIVVKAIISCSNCGYKKVFKKTFDRDSLDMLVVSAKVMAWSVCDCGKLVEFSMEFSI